jgi:glutathione S-transferase
VIQESSIIVEFLEELFTDRRPLLPTDIYARARSRLLARIADLYLMPPMVGLANPEVDGQQERRL